MKHIYKLLFVSFLLPLFSIAQSNYKPGYVVTLKGDTIHGFIDYLGWDSNPTTISFKTAVDVAKPQRLGLNSISFFSVDNLESYQKYVTYISMDESEPSRVSSGRDTSFKIDTVFLKILQKGKNLALYSYSDNTKTRFYIGETPAYTPLELVYRMYLDNVATNSSHGTVHENTYLKQLFALANKYNALDDKLTSVFENQFTGYNKSDLLTIVSRINNISKAEFEKKYTEHTKFNFYAGVAVNISTTKSNAPSLYTLGGGGPYTSYEPAFSFGINVIPNPTTDKVDFRLEALFAETQFNSSYQLKISPYVGVRTSFNQLGISIIPQIIYNFYKAENYKFYVGFGFALTHFSYSNAFFRSQNTNTSDNGIVVNVPYYFSTIDNSLLLKAGVKFNKKLEIFANYFTNTATSQGGYFAFVNNSKQVGIVYLIGK